MIITKIRLQEENPMTGSSDSWPLPVCDLELNSSAGENGFLLKDSKGLEPPDLNEIVDGFDIYGTPAIDDFAENRELVFKIGLNPGIGQSFSMLREHLYKFISRSILIKLMNEAMTIAQIVGYIHKFETVHFSNKPEVQITIQCQSAEFASPQRISIPFSDLSVTSPVINYDPGTAPTGIDFRFTVNSNHSEFHISNHSRIRSLSTSPLFNMLQLNYPLLVGDVISISTQPKSKRIILLRSGVYYDVAGYVNAGAVWPKLYPGVNTFDWNIQPSWMSWLEASYIPRYWGV